MNYDISYTGAEEGAGDGQTISNVRREKAEINVTKTWKSPADLDNLEGVSIVMKMVAVDSDGKPQTLTVYSDEKGSYRILQGDELTEALTISGFDRNVSVLDGKFYVNIYDAYGMPFNLSAAQITETAVIKDGVEIPVHGGSYFYIDGDKYQISSEYDEERRDTLADGMQTFGYDLANTISGERNYGLLKRWSDNFGDYYDVEYVEFTISRRSSRADALDVYMPCEGGPFRVSKNNAVLKDGFATRDWLRTYNFPKYDEDGYAYLYRAQEIALVKTDGTSVPVGSDSGWHVQYVYSDDRTIAINYRTTGPMEYLRLSKQWIDNGDMSAHGEIRYRVYRKADLARVLADVSDEAIIPLSSLEFSSVPYYEGALNKGNDWYSEVSVLTIEQAMQKKTDDDLHMGKRFEDYIAFEYLVSDGTLQDGHLVYGPSAKYPAAAILAAAKTEDAAYTADGFVMSSSRQYNTGVERAAEKNGIVFTNTRVGQINIVVEKTWMDANPSDRPEYIEFRVKRDGEPFTTDLPTPTIHLYRSSEPINLSGKSQDEIKALLEEGRITWVNDTKLGDDKFAYAFPDVSALTGEQITALVNQGMIDAQEDGSYALPKFAPDGSAYYYAIWEELENDTQEKLYSKLTASGTLVNTFRDDVNRRRIEVTKNWANRTGLSADDQKYPSVTFYLYRYINGHDPQTAQLIDTKLINADKFTGTGQYSVAFEDLLVYSPRGDLYCYYVTEKKIDGYSISYTDDDRSDDVADLQADVTHAPEDPFSTTPDTAHVSTINSYDQAGRIAIHGGKSWNDYGLQDYRPGTITLELRLPAGSR